MRETYASSSASSASSPRVADVPAQISVSRDAPSRTRSRRIEAREVGPLSAVERVQLVHHQVSQRARLVVPPEPEVERPDQQVVQHLVVRQQDVRRPCAQRVPVGDDVFPAIVLWAERCGWLSRPTKTPAVTLPRSAGVRSMVWAMRRA